MKHLLPTISRRRFLAAAGVAAAAKSVPSPAHAQAADQAASPYTLHFAQPANAWPDALPVGNGRLGAMVFGGITHERIQLNEESIWDGEPNRDRNNPRAAAAIPRIREMLFSGRIAEAQALALTDVLSVPRRMPLYQTLGDLHLDFSPMALSPESVTNYRLQLDLDTAVVTTSFTHNGVNYRREVFCSAPDQAIVIRLTASAPRSLSLRATLDRPGSFAVTSPARERLVIEGQALPVNDNPNLPVKENQTGVRFRGELLLVATGASATFGRPEQTTAGAPQPALSVQNADSITLFFDCATSYRYPARNGKPSGIDADVLTGDPAAMRTSVEHNLAAASSRPYTALLTRHLADHQRYFRRASIDFGPDPNAAVPTDNRMARVKSGAEDIHLVPIYFQLGRYMLLSSSRPGTLAANLQGIWNESITPPWGSKYTVNINTEMNYWFAESANLSECHLPIFDLLESTRKQGSVTAKEMYGARGSVIHHNTDLWGDSGPIDALGGGIWPMGANWLALHLWTHYEYTQDRRFLADHTYPALRERALFLLDYLVRDPATGHLVTGPSCSPENAYQAADGKSYNLCMGPTMDISITRALFARLLQSAALLPHDPAVTADADLLARVRQAWSQLPPFQIGHDGRLQEWQHDYPDHEPGHRHISHLFGLFPEDQITPDTTPDLAHAASLVLQKRLDAGGGSTGWSRAWIINCMARLREPEAAHAQILELFRLSTLPNLLDVCGIKENSPYQIDGNLGAPNAFIEMLLQSHGATPLTPPSPGEQAALTDTPTLIRLLPALPEAWPTGSFRGLRARGNAELDLSWNNGRLLHLELRAGSQHTFRILPPPGTPALTRLTRNNRPVPPPTSGPAIDLKAEPGTTYTLHFS